MCKHQTIDSRFSISVARTGETKSTNNVPMNIESQIFIAISARKKEQKNENRKLMASEPYGELLMKQRETTHFQVIYYR